MKFMVAITPLESQFSKSFNGNFGGTSKSSPETKTVEELFSDYTSSDKGEITLLGENEVVGFDYNLTNSGFGAKHPATHHVTISGKIIPFTENSNLSMLKGVNDKIGGKFPGSFPKNPVMNKVTNSLGSTDNNSLENTIELKKWATDFNLKSDYRDVLVSVVLGDDEVLSYKFSQMYVLAYSESLSNDGGVGSFSVTLGQRVIFEGTENDKKLSPPKFKGKLK